MDSQLKALLSMLSPFPGTTNGWVYNALVLLIGIIVSIIFFKRYRDTKSRQLLNSLPGLWTSLGILGTFIAICISLGGISSTGAVAKEGMTLGEIAALGGVGEVNIKQIISDLIPAFSTSIWGLIAAFCITIRSKIVYAREDAMIDAAVGNKTPEEYIFEISKTVQEQSIHNKEYNEKLNQSINGQSAILAKFVDDFVEKMDEIFKGMGKSIKENITEFGEQQFRNSANVLEEVVKKMAESSDKLMTQQTSTMSSIVNTTNEEIGKISKSLVANISTFNKDTVEAVVKLMESQNEKMTSTVDNTNEKMREISETLTSTISSFNKDTIQAMNNMMVSQREQIQSIVDKNVQSIDRIAATQDEKLSALVETHTTFTSKMMTDTAEMNKQLTDEVRNSLSALASSLQTSVKTQCDALGLAIVENTKLLKENYEFISERVAELQKNYEQSVLAFSDAVQNAHDYNESIEQKIKALDSSLKVLNTTNENVGEIAEIVRERYEKIEHLVTNINEISTAINTLQKLESQLNKINQKVG